MIRLFEFLNQTVKPPKDVFFERFLEKLNPIFGDHPDFWLPKKQHKDDPLAVVIIYKGVPAADYISAVTYGLSIDGHEQWHNDRPELCIAVQSVNENWAKALGHLVSRLRGDCPFLDGQLIRFGAPIVEEATMDAFFVSSPFFLDEVENRFDIDANYHIKLQALYPLREEEIPMYEKLGPKAFVLHPDFAPFDVSRPSVL